MRLLLHDYQLCVKTRYQERDKEIVEVPWCSTLWQSFNWKTSLFPSDVHLCSLCLLALPKESLGYTAPMGVPPKVQPMFVSSI